MAPVPVGSLCVVSVQWWGAGSVGTHSTTWNGLGRWWMLWFDEAFPLGFGVTGNHVWPVACWITLCGLCAVVFGAGSVVGPTPPPGTVLEGGGGTSLEWNYSSWLVNLSTWVWVL
jgi:hypothetical protein